MGTERDVWAPPVAAAGAGTGGHEPARPRNRRDRRQRRGFDAFISYSHRREGETALARQIEHGLEQIGRRWTQRRALNVFLDQNDLGANSELTPRLRGDLEQSAWLVFLASPESAASESYCARELAHWFETRSDAADRLLIVLTGGTLAFRDGAGDGGTADVVDWERSTAAPEAFRRLTKEPTYVDLTWTTDHVAELNIRHHARFREAVTWVAAPIHGYESPQELDSEDLRRYRRGRRLRRVGMAALVVLAGLATGAAFMARDRQQEANRQLQRSESRALASTALANAGEEHDLALLQALESVRRAGTAQAWGSLLGVLNEPSRLEQRSTGAHQTQVTALAVSPDGRLAASGAVDGSVVVWSVDPEASARPASAVTVIEHGLPSWVEELDVTDDDGRTVVRGLAGDGTVRSWDAESGTLSDESFAAQGFQRTARSTDGALVAGIFDSDGDEWGDQVMVVDAATGDIVGEGPPGTDLTSTDLSFRPGTWVLAWNEANTIVTWDLAGSDEPQPLGDPLASQVASIAFSPDGGLLAVGEAEGDIWIVDMAADSSASWLAVEPSPSSPAWSLAFGPDGARDTEDGVELASAHNNGDVRVWSVYVDFASEQALMRGHRDMVTAIAFRPGGQLVSAGSDGDLLWWDDEPTVGLTEEVLPVEGDAPASDVVDIAFVDEHGAELVALDFADQLVAIDENGNGERWPDIETDTIDAAGNTFAFALEDGSITVRVAAVDGGSRSERSLRGDWSAELLDLSDDGEGLLAVGDGAVVWDVREGSVKSRLDVPEDFQAFAALHGSDGRVWLGGYDDEGATAIEFDADTGARIGQPLRGVGSAANIVSVLALSPDGTTLATGDWERTVRLWDADTHEPLDQGTLSGHRGRVTGLAFTGADQLISVDEEGGLNIWDFADRQLITALTGPGISALAVSADGTTLAVGSWDDSVYRWTLDRREWIERACELATRNMTAAEWERNGRGPQVRLCDHPGEGPLVDWSERVGA